MDIYHRDWPGSFLSRSRAQETKMLYPTKYEVLRCFKKCLRAICCGLLRDQINHQSIYFRHLLYFKCILQVLYKK